MLICTTDLRKSIRKGALAEAKARLSLSTLGHTAFAEGGIPSGEE